MFNLGRTLVNNLGYIIVISFFLQSLQNLDPYFQRKNIKRKKFYFYRYFLDVWQYWGLIQELTIRER